MHPINIMPKEQSRGGGGGQEIEILSFDIFSTEFCGEHTAFDGIQNVQSFILQCLRYILVYQIATPH